MFHRLFKLPSIPLSSNLAAVLLRRSVYALATKELPQIGSAEHS